MTLDTPCSINNKFALISSADGDELQRQWDSEFDRWRTDDLAAWRKEHDSYQDVADQCSTL